MSNEKLAALEYHSKSPKGKIETVLSKPLESQEDLVLAYSPGVAYPCLEIHNKEIESYNYTSRSNLVGIVTDGSAVLGLGNIGPHASKPVMEGKAMLFKKFGKINAFDIELDASDPEKFIEVTKALEPTFGGINLEDIKAPECFLIEETLKREMDIPVFHDDQHGTAIISAAALKNALDITNKKISEVQIVVNGAGAAAISCTKLYISLGAKVENIIMCDSKGVIRLDRDQLSPQKKQFATNRNVNTLEEVMQNADVFIGLSKGNVVTPEMLLSMAKNPIVFAMANPEPEISYDLACATREDIIMATGRSDHPNQVNNVLGFPFIFRGALDVRATKINEEMKMAAVNALADLAKKSVPEQVNIVYDEVSLSYGKEYIIPKPFDPRLIYEIPPAIAKAAIESGVAQEPIKDWDKYRDQLMDRSGIASKEIRLLHNRAKRNPKKIVFAEADHLDVLKAAQRVYEEKIGHPILLGRKEVIVALKEELGFEAEVPIFDPKTDQETERRDRFAVKYWKTRQRKGISLSQAKKLMRERNYFAAMMVNEGEADALITGYSRPYPTVVKPMIELIGRDRGVSRIAATNLMLTKQGPMFLADTTININPTAKDLAKISQMTYKLAKMFGMKPNIAMLSFSNFGSTNSESSRKIQDAISYIHRHFPHVNIDGELQADFALNPAMLAKEFPFSKLNGKKVNVLIFPNLESANITYKLLKQIDGSESIGPIILGFKKPAHIIQLGASVDEMVNMAAVAVVDAQQKQR